MFPKNLPAALRVVKITPIRKHLYTVCPHAKCSALYKADDLNSINRSCTSILLGRVCGSSLGYDANLAHGRKKWKPFKTFHFYPPSDWLKKFFAQNEFIDQLYQGNRQKSNVFQDVYDGQIWKDFVNADFFNTKYNVGLMLYIDWFKPFKRSEYAVGALMLTVLNLPRTERFKKKWTIVAGKLMHKSTLVLVMGLLSTISGIIPGPHEPPGNINTYLKPLVDDLISLWIGVSFGKHTIRAAVMVMTADMPALRKLTQFLGHKANLGCSRCKFRAEREPGTVGATGRMSYLTPVHFSDTRTHEDVVKQAKEYHAASTKALRATLAQANGVRYSELIRIPYLDMVSE